MKKLLDHGYVSLIETWGSDERVIESARMSTDKGFLGWGEHYVCPVGCGCKWRDNKDGTMSLFDGEQKSCSVCEKEPLSELTKVTGDEKLLAYLYNNKHSTPFEMAGMIIEVKAPIFVFREWHRHRTQSYNEMSARYVPLPNENYLPALDRLLVGANTATTNKQAQGNGRVLTEHDAFEYRQRLENLYQYAEDMYQTALTDGVPKELARVVLPVARYSKMRAQANLRNWLAFLTLRKAPAAQYEIRVYAEAVAELIAEHFPRTYELFDKEQKSGV
jgi:thymidylate synthase (FAD)